jgi:hypothetical protein
MLRLPIGIKQASQGIGSSGLPAPGRAKSWVVAIGQSSAEQISTVKVGFWEACRLQSLSRTNPAFRIYEAMEREMRTAS